MILLVLAPLAWAAADRPLPRVDEILQTRRYWAVEGDGPYRPRWRNRRGKHQCWTWPDGIAEHCDRYEGRQVVERRQFGAGGHLLATTTITADGPTQVTVHGISPVQMDVAAWSTRPLGALTLRAPTDASSDTWVVADGTIRVNRVPMGDGDLFGPDLRRGLRAWCACVIEDRSTAWIDGVTGVRYRVRHPHPTAPVVGEVWAVPQGDDVVLIGFVVAGGGPLPDVERRLAGGRATIALARWSKEVP